MDKTVHPLWLAIGGLVAMAAAMGVGRFVYTPILPFMSEGLDLTKSEAGLIASANYAGYLAGALLATAPVVPGSRRWWLLGSLAASALSTAAMGVFSSVFVFLLLRFIGGVASAFVLVFVSSLVLDRLHLIGRGNMASTQFAGVGVGMAVSAVLVSAFSAWDIGWRGQWIAAGLVSFIAVLLVAYFVPDRHDQPQPSNSDANGKGLTALVIAYGLVGFGYVITATFLVTIVRESDAIRPLEPTIWLIVGLSAAPSVAFWNWVGSKTGLIQAFAIGCVAEAIGVAASVLWISVPGVILAAVLLGGTFVGITYIGLITARELAKTEARRIIAAMTAAFGLGQIIGPVFAGVVFDYTGSFSAPSLIAVAALLIAAIMPVAVYVRKS